MILVVIQGVMLATAGTARAFQAVNAIYGGRLRITSPDGGWRSYLRQAWLRARYLLGLGSYAAPAGQSNHEQGRALDISNWALFPDLQQVMRRHNFVRDPIEKWHYNYVGTEPAGLDPAPVTPEQPKELDMKLIKHPNGSMAIASGTRFKIISPYTADSLVPVWGAIVPVSEDAWTFQQQFSTGA